MHIHDWGKWEEASKYSILSVKTQNVVGERIVQIKECKVCGLKKYKVTRLGME